jgi:nicotinamidase-related amidase
MSELGKTHSLDNAALREQYARAGFAGRVGFGRHPALLVIDMAHAWTRPTDMIGADMRGVLDAVLELLGLFRTRELPIFFTTMAYDAGLAEVPEVMLRKTPHARQMIRGSERVQLVPELERRADEPLIEKPRASAFFATNLLSMLIGRGVDTTVVVGGSTSGCIRATCESAFDLGFHAIVPLQAVGDRSPSAHTGALFDIDARLADVMPLAEVLDHLAEPVVTAS